MTYLCYVILLYADNEGIVMAMDMGLTCDTCGERITSPEQGLIEWYISADEHGIRRFGNLRLVHVKSASPLTRIRLKRKGCSFDLREEFFVPEGTVESRALSEFLGPDGLMRLLSFIGNGDFPVAEVLKMIKRLNVPGYETARHYLRRAISEGAIPEQVSQDYPEQKDINVVLEWLEQKRKTA